MVKGGALASKFTLGTTHISFIIADAINIIIISILYGIGRDKNCDMDIKRMVLAYIIIKSSFWLLRWLCWGIMIIPSIIPIIVNLGFLAFWILGMTAYYIVALMYFFNSNNDWQEHGVVIWVAMLLIVLESILMLIVVSILLLILWCNLPSMILFINKSNINTVLNFGKLFHVSRFYY